MCGTREPGFGKRGQLIPHPGMPGSNESRESRIPNPESRSTTDPQDERFDVLDPDGRPTGSTKRRGDIHRDGDWHGALHIWVGGVGGDGVPFVLFQRRSPTKDTWPGYLDTTIGGHIRSGETLDETVREAEEEIGLAVGLADLTFIGRRFVEGGDGVAQDREIQSVYAVRCDQLLTEYRLHPEEVSAIVAIPLASALRLFAGDLDSVTAQECPRDAEPFNVTLTRDDFVGSHPGYPLAALHALQLTIDGATPEPFELRPAEPDR